MLAEEESWRDRDERSNYNYRGRGGRNFRGRGRGRGASRGGYRNRSEHDVPEYLINYSQACVFYINKTKRNFFFQPQYLRDKNHSFYFTVILSYLQIF